MSGSQQDSMQCSMRPMADCLAEVERLRARRATSSGMPSMRCVGYRQAWEYIDGEIDAKSLRETGIAAMRQLAKRQMTWLRGMPAVESFDCLRADLAEAVTAGVNTFLG